MNKIHLKDKSQRVIWGTHPLCASYGSGNPNIIIVEEIGKVTCLKCLDILHGGTGFRIPDFEWDAKKGY